MQSTKVNMLEPIRKARRHLEARRCAELVFSKDTKPHKSAPLTAFSHAGSPPTAASGLVQAGIQGFVRRPKAGERAEPR